VESSKLSSSAIKAFQKATVENLMPLAKQFGLDFEQIDPCLFMLSSEPITIKIYFPECHGYDIDVKIAPTRSREWYSSQEKSIYWVGLFLGLGEFATSRATSEEKIARLVKVNADFLRQILPLLNPPNQNFWEDLTLFIQDEIAQKEEHDRQGVEEQYLSEIRYKIDLAWRAKDYAQVISLFEEIKEKMTPAESKKLEHARKYTVQFNHGAS
jgi:hypothetical protein